MRPNHKDGCGESSGDRNRELRTSGSCPSQMQRTENIRSLAAELHGQRDYTDAEMDYFELVEDILTATKGSDGGHTHAEDAMLSWMRRHYDVQEDNDCPEEFIEEL